MVLVIALSSLENIISATRNTGPLMNGFHAQFMITALSSDWVTLAIPIVCALPFTTAFVDDVKSGFIKQYLHRTSIKQYIRAKLFACGLSGGLVLFFGIVIAYALSALVFTPMELALGEGETAQPYFAQLLMVSATLFFSGAFWSLVGFAFSAATMSKYMAYASPFILYYVLIILNERYFENLYVLYPKEWLFPSDVWVLGSLGVILLLAELTAIISLAFAVTAKRRLANV
ncbi:MAG: hypothetical protein PHO15_02980 [Eubacteriales bacterium]|nr:hypothetical protein [Eubacteriales bacterium]